MASVTDLLTTVLQLKGTAQYVKGLNAAAAATSELAVATAGAGAVGGATGAMANLAETAKGAGAELAAVAAAVAFSTKTFADDELAIARTTVVLRNLGSSLPIAELIKYSQTLSDSTGVDDEKIVALGGLLARFHLTGDGIKSSLRPILDASAATGISIEQIAESIGKAVQTGQGRGLRELGVTFKSTGDKAKDLKQILDQLDQSNKGFASIRTTAHDLQQLATAFSNLASAIGEKFASALQKIQPFLLGTLKLLTDFAPAIIGLVGLLVGARFGPIGAIIGGLLGAIIGAQAGKANPAAAIGGGQTAAERYLKTIADNTDPNKQADKLAREVLGGAGTVAAEAANWRDYGMAMGV